MTDQRHHSDATLTGHQRRRRFLLLATLMGVVILGFWLAETNVQEPTATPPGQVDMRMPVSDVPLEPDRPDLIGEPRINDPKP